MAGDTGGADESTLTSAEADAKREDAREPGASPGTAEARACVPCRGTGKVISNLGGTRSEVACPWCLGTGTRQGGVDAQEHWREQRAAADLAAGEGTAGDD
jgi:hypothetical protein